MTKAPRMHAVNIRLKQTGFDNFSERQCCRLCPDAEHMNCPTVQNLVSVVERWALVEGGSTVVRYFVHILKPPYAAYVVPQ